MLYDSRLFYMLERNSHTDLHQYQLRGFNMENNRLLKFDSNNEMEEMN